MPRERLSMRKIKELLRLKFESGLSTRDIASSLRISVGSVHGYLARAHRAGLVWPLPDNISEEQLETQLFGVPEAPLPSAEPVPDWIKVDKDLKRKGVTLLLLWEEYRATNPVGLGYSQFCKRFRAFKNTLDPRMRQTHRAGEKLFVDYPGMTLPLTDPTTGEVRYVQIFTAVLGASSYTYAEPTLTQSIPDWIGAHVRAFAYFGGVPELIVCDNLKSAVTTPCRYQPDIQRTYEDMAAHYGAAILPARIVKPRDKAKVEAAVQSVEQRMLAPLRNRQFFSLLEINEALAPLLHELNHRQMQGRSYSRAELFAQIDKPALKPLPANAYEVCFWSQARVNIDYHVEVDKRYYSVPYRLIHKMVEVRVAGAVVEIYYKGERVASHTLIAVEHDRDTHNEHMPESHRSYDGWTPERMLAWVAASGPCTREVGKAILAGRPHPQQGFRACLGVIRLGERYGSERIEAASRKALAIRSPSYKTLSTILKNGMDLRPDRPVEDPKPPIEHHNIRGANYYQGPTTQTEASRDASMSCCRSAGYHAEAVSDAPADSCCQSARPQSQASRDASGGL